MNNDNNNYNPYQNAPIIPPVMPPVAPMGYQPAPKKSSGLGIASICLSLTGCCCCGITSLIGLILGIIGVVKNKNDVTAIVGIVLSAITLLYMIYSFVVTDWNMALNFSDQYLKNYENYLSSGDINDLMEGFEEFAAY
ncbi:MAG: hypothetical protein LBL82_05200 [Oscillospiraceae bacterium]|jgi:amino acid transporter|nr:hypothetical protein [Oscillospiraceae bacterium]